jgi:ribosomal protein S12 methylthiotransferase accessory factor
VLTPELHDIDLGSPQGKALLEAVAVRHGDLITRAASRMDRMFLLRSPWAPGLRFVGALASSPHDASPAGSVPAKVSFAGAGESLENAFAACLGEAVERLSQYERADDVTPRRIDDVTDSLLPPFADLVVQQRRSKSASPSDMADWTAARHLGTATSSLVPSDWVLRRATEGALRDRDAALSSGAAAGASPEAAATRALLELVERDAAALWWVGGQRARPLSAETDGLAEAARLARFLRQGAPGRTSWCLDITSDLGIPVVAAVSVDPTAKGFVCGLAARLTLVDAVRSAMVELCQLEIGLMLAAAKRGQTGDHALGELDRRHLRRADTIDAQSCVLLHPVGMPQRHVDPEPLPQSDAQQLECLSAALATAGIESMIVDLTRAEYGIPVVKAVAPQLQALPSSLTTTRLCDAIARTGGGNQFTGGTPLT